MSQSSSQESTPAAPKRLTPEEIAAKYAKFRARAAVSNIFAEARDPNLAVKWVRDDKDSLTMHRIQGFSIAREPNPKASEDQRLFKSINGCDPDGCYRHGDVILMVADRDEYDFHFNEGLELSRQRVESGKDSFPEAARKSGATAFQRDRNGRVLEIQ